MDIEAMDALLSANVVRYDARAERGSPRSISSSYISGYREVPNPFYAAAVGAVQAAETALEAARRQQEWDMRELEQQAEQARARRQPGVENWVNAREAQIARQARNKEIAVVVARAALAAIPQTVQREEVSPYNIVSYTPKANVSIQVAWKIVDRRSMRQVKTGKSEVREESQGRIIENVEPTDKNGHQPIHEDVDLPTLVDASRQKLTRQLQSDVVTAVRDFQRGRFWNAAEEFRKLQKTREATENFLLFVENERQTAGEKAAQAAQYTIEKAGISPDVAHLKAVADRDSASTMWPDWVAAQPGN